MTYSFDPADVVKARTIRREAKTEEWTCVRSWGNRGRITVYVWKNRRYIDPERRGLTLRELYDNDWVKVG